MEALDAQNTHKPSLGGRGSGEGEVRALYGHSIEEEVDVGSMHIWRGMHHVFPTIVNMVWETRLEITRWFYERPTAKGVERCCGIVVVETRRLAMALLLPGAGALLHIHHEQCRSRVQLMTLIAPKETDPTAKPTWKIGTMRGRRLIVPRRTLKDGDDWSALTNARIIDGQRVDQGRPVQMLLGYGDASAHLGQR